MFLCLKQKNYISCTVPPHCVPCCHPQINTENGGLQQQQAIHGDILSELQSHHPFLLQPAKEVCFCGPPTTQKSDTSLSSITNTSRHRCYWPSWRPASTAPFALLWYLHLFLSVLSCIHWKKPPFPIPSTAASYARACRASQLSTGWLWCCLSLQHITLLCS